MSPNFKRLAAAGCIVAATFSFTTRAASATSLNVVMSTNNSLVNDLTSMSDSAKTSDTQGLSEACAALTIDAETALRYHRPHGVPASAWTHMRNAWVDYSRAGDLCDEGATNNDASLIARSTTLMTDATTETKTATRILAASRG